MSNFILSIFIVILSVKLGYDISDIKCLMDGIDELQGWKDDTDSKDKKQEYDEYIYENEDIIDKKITFSIFNIFVLLFILYVFIRIN